MIWPHMGPWPVYFGFTTSEKRFKREMKRLGIKGNPFILNDHSDATLHSLTNPEGKACYILAMRKPRKGITKAQIAAMIAHEAVHVIQYMRENLGPLGTEAEAYIVQYITQSCLIALRDKTC